MSSFELATDEHRAELGEGPIWSARENALYWVDVLGRRAHRLALNHPTVSTWMLPEMISWLIERQGHPGFIAGLESGFVELTLDPFLIRPIGDPEPHLQHSRMNDAKVDAEGRIWAGTMDLDGAVPVGALYRFDRDHVWHKMDAGYLVSNGPTFSVDGRFLYHTDSYRHIVYRFELRADGTLANKTRFIEFEQSWGFPDGMTTDAQDYLWIAHYGGGRITRFDPAGNVDREVKLPASQITSCVFAGPQLDRMFVTSAACGVPGEALAGSVFEIDPGVRGVVQKPFAG